MSPPTDTRPAAVALADLPCRSLPEATDICLQAITGAEAEPLASDLNTMSPSAFTAPLTRTEPSVTTVKLPSWVSSPKSASPSSTPTPESMLGSSSVRKSSRLTVIVPPATSSTTVFPPAPIAMSLTPLKSPPARSTDLERSISLSATKVAPASDEIAPAPHVLNAGAGTVRSPSIAAWMSSLLARSAVATPKSPPTLTYAPLRNETPAGLNIHSWPLAVKAPCICDALPPETTLKNWSPEKLRDWPEPMLSAYQSIRPALPVWTMSAADRAPFGVIVAPIAAL